MTFSKASIVTLLGTAALSLSACGSSELSLDDLTTRGETLAESFDAAELTAADAMPTEGTASYDGVAAFGSGAAPASATDLSSEDVLVASQVELNADFAANEIDGRFWNFRATDGVTPVSGEVAITDGAITDNTFAANVGGDLIVEGETETLLGTMSGEFRGENAAMFGATVDGTFADGEGFFGVAVGEKQ